MRLSEIVNNLRTQTEIFLGKWTEGSSRATLHMTPAVKSDLKRTVDADSYTVYRGWKFADEDLVGDIFGSHHSEIKPGALLTVHLDTPHSWTKDRTEAVKFANPRFDSLEKDWFDDEAIEEHGYENGDLLGIGILVSAVIPASKVIADLDNVDDDLLSYNNEEHEIITDKGSFTVKVIDVQVHHFNRIDDEPEDDDMSEEEWAHHNRETSDENEQMLKVRKELPALLKKHGLKANEEGLIKLLDIEKRQDVAIAVVMQYGHELPKVKQHAVNRADSYEKTYKHFNVKGIAAMIDLLVAGSQQARI
jgi:hypothetical protein